MERRGDDLLGCISTVFLIVGAGVLAGHQSDGRPRLSCCGRGGDARRTLAAGTAAPHFGNSVEMRPTRSASQRLCSYLNCFPGNATGGDHIMKPLVAVRAG